MKLIVGKDKENTLLPRLMKGAVKLFVEKGIDGTTIKDIAQKTGVSEGALYRHFKSKEELAWSLFSTHVNAFSLDLMDKVGRKKSMPDKIRAYISTCFKAFETEKDLFTYLILSEHRELRNFPETHVHPGHVALRLMEEGQKSGEFKKMDIYVGASILVGSLIRLCVTRIYGGVSKDLRTLEEDLADSLWKALKK